MLRIRVTVSFLALTIAFVVAALVATNHYEDEQVRSLNREIAGSANAYERLQDLRSLRLRSMAQVVATSDVSAVMSMLHEDTLGDRMKDVEAQLFARFGTATGSKPGVGVHLERMSYLRSNMKAFLNEFLDGLLQKAELLHGRDAWPKEERKKFREEYEGALVKCLAYNTATCLTTLTLLPLRKVVKEITDSKEFGLVPEMVVVATPKLRRMAVAGNEDLGAESEFGERYPVLREVVPSKVNKLPRIYAHDVIPAEAGGRPYFVIAHQIVDDVARHVGAVLLGVRIDENFVQGEKKTLGMDVTYVDGRSQRALRSTLKGFALAEIRQKLPSGPRGGKSMRIETEHLVGQYVPLDTFRSKAAVAVVFTRNRKEALSVVRTLKGMVPLVGIIFFIFGSILLMWSIQSHIDALVQVDSGIHEVISGNQNHEFAFDYKDERLSSMAQSLNLMVAVLVGRDTDEQESDTSWMQAFLEEESDLEPADAQTSESPQKPEPTEQGAAPVPASSDVGVDRPAEEAAHTSNEDAELAVEPAESYYRRIYSEFTHGRKEAGGEAISYVRFVEKVVRQERVLRNQLECRMVRFRVVQRDDGPALLPVKID